MKVFLLLSSISFRDAFVLEEDKVTFYVSSYTKPGIVYDVQISKPRGFKGQGRSPLRRFRASCSCEAGTWQRGSKLKSDTTKCKHVALIFGNFFAV